MSPFAATIIMYASISLLFAFIVFILLKIANMLGNYFKLKVGTREFITFMMGFFFYKLILTDWIMWMIP